MELTNDRIEILKDYCKTFNLDFTDLTLLNKAFIHKSANLTYNNERLEFLGDALLEVITVEYIYYASKKSEGDLSKIKSAAVNENTLCNIAKKLKIPEMLILGKGEELSNGRKTKSLLADGVEALIGAYYEDCKDFEKVKKFVQSFIIDEINDIENKKGYIDYKSILQEFCQKNLRRLPNYEIVHKSGPDHAVLFWVKVSLFNLENNFKYTSFGPGCGRNKKEAEQNVAKIAIEKLGLIKKETL